MNFSQEISSEYFTCEEEGQRSRLGLTFASHDTQLRICLECGCKLEAISRERLFTLSTMLYTHYFLLVFILTYSRIRSMNLSQETGSEYFTCEEERQRSRLGLTFASHDTQLHICLECGCKLEAISRERLFILSTILYTHYFLLVFILTYSCIRSMNLSQETGSEYFTCEEEGQSSRLGLTFASHDTQLRICLECGCELEAISREILDLQKENRCLRSHAITESVSGAS